MSERRDVDDVIKQLFIEFEKERYPNGIPWPQNLQELLALLYEFFKGGYLKGYLRPSDEGIFNLTVYTDGKIRLSHIKDGKWTSQEGRANPATLMASMMMLIVGSLGSR